nr:hypothetical protein HK105_002623 [Polyrhizophydium stewartii]
MEPQRDLSLFMAVPTIYAKLAAHYDTMSPEDKQRATEACSQFRLMVSGSSALPQVVAEKWRAISGHELLERYGMTEVGMALGNPIDGPRVLGEVGVPFSGVEARIVNPDTGADLTASPNEPGHLQIRGPQVFDRYWGREEATREAFSEPGHWFLTGDVACCTERGTFKILGRASVDIIKVGGYKISALDIEREILDHPDVAEVAVVGIPSTEWGERIGAIVVHKPATAGQLSLDSLRTWLASRLAPYKLPTRLLIVDEIPKNAMGKVNKKELVKLFN